MPFVGTRVTQAIWPELTGVVTYAGAALVGAAIDAQRAEPGAPIPFPLAQTLVSAGALGGGIYGIGSGKAVDFSTGLLFGAGVGLTINLIHSVYDRVSGQARVMRMSDVAALVPRTVAARRLPSPRPGALEALGLRGKQAALVGGRTEEELAVVTGVPARVQRISRYE